MSQDYQNDRIREICPSLIKLAFADCLTCRAICELLGACREARKGVVPTPPLSFPIQDPSIKLKLCWTSCLRERVKTSIHSPSHRQKSLVHTFPAKKPHLQHPHQIICLQTDIIIQRTKGGKKHQCCPQIYLEIPCLHRVPLTQRQFGVG